ncbi:MAG: hypothetical protein K0R24_204 [Gammaproteobacteria bacterium]|jgi:hypothetical protein|nr:hypothetical protein [Gammaproteobacteria bacterium]
MSVSALIERINLNTLSPSERQSLAKMTYEQESYFQHLFNQDHIELTCEKFSHAFRDEIERILIEKELVKEKTPLENLHEVLSDEMKTYNFNDGVNKISTYFYETDASFMTVYHQYIRFLRECLVKEPFWFQGTPTIRIHCPNAKNSHHYPRYHTDISYGHPPEEINIWFPLTPLLTGHGFRIMSVSSSKKIIEQFDYDYSKFIHAAIHDKNFSFECDTLSASVTTPFGKMLAFDPRCVHTGVPLTAHSRVSIDIRILPVSQYEKMTIEYQGSGRRKILFAPNHCYNLQNSDTI